MTDVTGRYSYEYNQTRVLVELTPTGVFTITGSKEYSGNGKWEITPDNSISLHYHDTAGARDYTVW
jgi:hypothetical protein